MFLMFLKNIFNVFYCCVLLVLKHPHANMMHFSSANCGAGSFFDLWHSVLSGFYNSKWREHWVGGGSRQWHWGQRLSFMFLCFHACL